MIANLEIVGQEGALIEKEKVKQVLVSPTKTKVKNPIPFSEEWIKFLIGSSNGQSTNTHELRNLYSFFRDTNFPNTNGGELSCFLYDNKLKKPPTSNPWYKNLGKLFIPEVLVNGDLVKALFKAYNPTTQSFHK